MTHVERSQRDACRLRQLQVFDSRCQRWTDELRAWAGPELWLVLALSAAFLILDWRP